MKRVQDDLTAAKASQANADQLSAQLKTTQQQLTDSRNQIGELQTQVDALKSQLQQKSTGIATTRPTMDMNK